MKLPTKQLTRLLPDSWHARALFIKEQGAIPQLNPPRSFSEKIQWLKLYGNMHQYAPLVDKYEVRSAVAKRIGEQHLVPLLGVWKSFEDVPFDQLPDQFALKGTHGSGYNFICRDKQALDVQALGRLAGSWLSQNYGQQSRERQYEACEPRLLAEQYLEDNSGGLQDYKFFCFHGEPELIQVDTGRYSDHRRDMLSLDWQRLPFTLGGLPNLDQPAARPENLEQMQDIARRLASGFHFVRVDLYSVDQHPYFGELTFTPGNGLARFEPRRADFNLGRLLDVGGPRPSC